MILALQMNNWGLEELGSLSLECHSKPWLIYAIFYLLPIPLP